MDILTDGQHAIHPVPTEGGDSIRFEPTLQRIGPRAYAQWWGIFEAGDRVAAHVRTSSDSNLTLEILDAAFRPLAVASSPVESPVLAEIQRSGIGYVRVHNTGGVGARILLQVARHRAAVEPSTNRRPSLLQRLGLRAA